jgi:CBS domain-containing protein
MICPDCKAENIAGAEFCASCGHDLHALALPSADDNFTSHLLNDRLGELQPVEAPVVSPRDPVFFAIHLMQQRRADCVLVKEGEHLAGILTERDVLLKAAGEKVDLIAVTVGEVMTRDPVVMLEDDTLAVALHRMSIGEFRHIPLVIDGRVTRVVSIQDVFRHVSAFIQEEPAPA